MKLYQQLITLTLTGLAIMLALASKESIAPFWLEITAILTWTATAGFITYKAWKKE